MKLHSFRYKMHFILLNLECIGNHMNNKQQKPSKSGKYVDCDRQKQNGDICNKLQVVVVVKTLAISLDGSLIVAVQGL